ncbi:hypothetical protein OK016_11095 [Vibrio chagasii]|nr:hypothetical protein [Vibrio chagasii]
MLLGQPELDARLEAYHLRQFRQRITLVRTLRALTLDETVAYGIDNRIAKSGGNPELFSLNQKKAIRRSSIRYPKVDKSAFMPQVALLVKSRSVTKVPITNICFSQMHETYDV